MLLLGNSSARAASISDVLPSVIRTKIGRYPPWSCPHATSPPRQLRHEHRHKLVPARHLAQLSPLVVLRRISLEFMSRRQLEKLRQHGIIVGHGSGSPMIWLLLANSIITSQDDSEPLPLTLCGTAMIMDAESLPTGEIAMKTEKYPSYKRAPSDELKNLLRPGRFLAPLLIHGSHNNHDLHFRSGNKVQIYRGLTSLLELHLKMNNQVTLTAHETYTGQECSGALFTTWKIDDHGFEKALDEYLNNVKVHGRHTKGEGDVQTRWARVAEYQHHLWKSPPWIPFDREARLDYSLVPDLKKEMALRDESPGEIDQLAVDPKGNLVLLELKDSGSKSIDDAPCQILNYIKEWHYSFRGSKIRNQIQKLIDARKELGLTPDNIPQLGGGIRAAICFGNYRHSSPPRTPEEPPTSRVKCDYHKALDVANSKLPSGIPPIETWKFDENGPFQVVRSIPRRPSATPGESRRQLGDVS